MNQNSPAIIGGKHGYQPSSQSSGQSINIYGPRNQSTVIHFVITPKNCIFKFYFSISENDIWNKYRVLFDKI